MSAKPIELTVSTRRLIRIALWFFGLLFAADISLGYMQQAIFQLPWPLESDWTLDGWLVLAAYAVAFGSAGALLARAAGARLGLPLAVILGLLPPLFSLLHSMPQPWMSVSHGGSLVFFILSWSNWYGPPLASAAGARIWRIFAGCRGRSKS